MKTATVIAAILLAAGGAAAETRFDQEGRIQEFRMPLPNGGVARMGPDGRPMGYFPPSPGRTLTPSSPFPRGRQSYITEPMLYDRLHLPYEYQGRWWDRWD